MSLSLSQEQIETMETVVPPREERQTNMPFFIIENLKSGRMQER